MAAQLTKSKCTSLFLSRKSFLFFITFYTKCSMLYTVLKIIDLWIIPQVTNTHTPAERNLGCITKVVLSREDGLARGSWAGFPFLWGAPGSEVCSCRVCEEEELWPHQLPGCLQALRVLHPWQGLQETGA